MPENLAHEALGCSRYFLDFYSDNEYGDVKEGFQFEYLLTGVVVRYVDHEHEWFSSFFKELPKV